MVVFIIVGKIDVRLGKGILGVSRFLGGIIFYSGEVLVSWDYEKGLFEDGREGGVGWGDIRLVCYVWSGRKV